MVSHRNIRTRFERVNFRVLPAGGLALLFVSISLVSAQINTEALRMDDRDPGWYHELSGNLGFAGGNTRFLNTRAKYRVDYFTETYHLFLVTSYYRRFKDDDLFIHKGFAHLRGERPLLPHFAIEGFLQREFNRFLQIQDRQLVGGGVRIKWYEKPEKSTQPRNLRLTTGVGLMWEQEAIDTTDRPEDINPSEPWSAPISQALITNYMRSTNYLVARWQPSERFSLLSTSYYQVRLRRFADFRILWDLSLNVNLTKRFAVGIGMNLRYDHEPPRGVKSLDVDFANVITLLAR